MPRLACACYAAQSRLALGGPAFGLQHRNKFRCQGPTCFSVANEDLPSGRSAGLGISQTNSIPFAMFRNFRLRFAAISPTTKRGLKLPTIRLAEVGDGEVPD